MKKKIIIIVLVLILILGSYFIYALYGYENNNYNKARTMVNEVLTVIDLFEKMDIEEYVVDDFVFTNINLSLNDGNDSIEVIFTSNISSDLVLFELNLYDKDEEKLESIDFSIDSLFEGEERNLFCYVDIDLSRVVSFDIKIKND